MRAEFTLPIHSEDYRLNGDVAKMTDCTKYENAIEIIIDGWTFSLDKDELRKVLAILD